jgi:excisionase family DNA binding protein
MTHKILNLKSAAEYLSFGYEYVRVRAQRGEIRGAKIGKDWRFFSGDLDAWLDAHCKGGINQREEEKCPSINIRKAVSGILTLDTRDKEYLEALGLKTKIPRNDITTKSRSTYGSKSA